MKNTDKIVGLIELFIVVALLLWVIVFSVISCVAETRMYLKMIQTGEMPVEVSYDKR